MADPPNEDCHEGNGDRITELWAWVSIDPVDNNEGIIATYLPVEGWMPLVGADRERIESLRPRALDTVKMTKQAVRLVRFRTREVLETIDP
jgi:hypothetical protein